MTPQKKNLAVGRAPQLLGGVLLAPAATLSLCPHASPCPVPMAVGCGTLSHQPPAAPLGPPFPIPELIPPFPPHSVPVFPFPLLSPTQGGDTSSPEPPWVSPSPLHTPLQFGEGGGLSPISAAPREPRGRCPAGASQPGGMDGHTGMQNNEDTAPGGSPRNPPDPRPGRKGGGRAAPAEERAGAGAGRGRLCPLAGARRSAAAPRRAPSPAAGARQKPAGARRSRRARSAQRSPAGMREAASGSGGAHPHPFPFASSPAGFGNLGST